MPDPDPLVVTHTVTHATGRYAVTVEPLAALPERLAQAGLEPGRILIVADDTVRSLHLPVLHDTLRAAGWQPAVFSVTPGEPSKSSETLAQVHDWALGLGITRTTPLLAFGGGVVGDLAGFAAATLLRGIPLVQVPTTTISQVDSAIGGKTGINHAVGKNLIGAFWAPRLVLADPTLLATLDERDYLSGLAEAVKHALLSGGDAIARLTNDWDALSEREASVVRETIARAAGVKCAVVSADEREGGQRAFLNLGHTFGHAVERVAGYGAVTHGEAVALGMRAALHLSAALAFGSAPTSGTLHAVGDGRFGSTETLVDRLPHPALAASITNEALVDAMATDKKSTADGLRFVVLEALGAPRLANSVSAERVLAALAWARAKPSAR